MNGCSNGRRRRRRVVLLTLGVGTSGVIGSLAARLALPEWPIAMATLTVTCLLASFLVLAIWRRVRRPQRDREAEERLQVLVDRTCTPDVDLLEVHATEWSSLAGQRALTIDVASGHQESVWFPQAHFPSGSLVLIRRAGLVAPLDWMPLLELRAAYRHRARACQHRARQAARPERRMAKELRAEAERIGVGRPPTRTITLAAKPSADTARHLEC